MSEIFSESFVMQRDSERAKTAYWVIAVLVALAMFVAASGSGSDMPMGDRTTPGWLDVLGNVFAVVFGILVLIPRTRILGAIFAVANMFMSMYVNYAVDGVGFFVDAIPYNTVTIMLGSILIGHHFEDLANLPRPPKPTLAGS